MIRAGRQLRLGAAMLGVIVGGSACAAGTVTVTEFEETTGKTMPTTARQANVAVGDGAEARVPDEIRQEMRDRVVERTTGGAAALGYGDGLVVARGAQAASKIADARLHSVTLYEGYGIVELADAKRPDRVDQYTVRPSSTSGPTAVPAADPAGAFAISDVQWEVIPSLLDPTLAAVGAERGRVSHVIVERNVPFTNDVVIRVYVSGARGGGRVDHFADGRQMRTFKD